jgi:uncharacterized Zn finger protein
MKKTRLPKISHADRDGLFMRRLREMQAQSKERRAQLDERRAGRRASAAAPAALPDPAPVAHAPEAPLTALEALRWLQRRAQAESGKPAQKNSEARPPTRMATVPAPVMPRAPSRPKDVFQELLRGRIASPVNTAQRPAEKSACSLRWQQYTLGQLERSDFRRCEAGFQYLEDGAVRDLHVESERIVGIVRGQEFYEVTLIYPALPADFWESLVSEGLKRIDTQVKLLRLSPSAGIPDHVWRDCSALYPRFSESQVHCTCPDPVLYCKHVIAVLYGVMMRLERDPYLLLTFRGTRREGFMAAAQARLQGERLAPRQRSRRLERGAFERLINEGKVGEPEVPAGAPSTEN